MKFENKSKSLLPISKDTLKDLCVQFGKDPRKLPRRGELSEDNYPLYVADITGYRPCEICNGPRGIVKLSESRVGRILFMHKMMDFQTFAIYSPIRCLRFPVHSIVARSRDPLSNWNRLVQPLCEHGYYPVECKICMEILYTKQTEVLHEVSVV